MFAQVREVGRLAMTGQLHDAHVMCERVLGMFDAPLSPRAIAAEARPSTDCRS